MRYIANKDASILPISEVRELSKLAVVKSSVAIFFEWTLICVLIFIHVITNNIIVYVFVWIAIGSRLFAVYSLLHEAVHYLLHSDKKINDRIASIFLAFPLFLSLSEMRIAHFAHHKYLKTENDPEIVHTEYPEFQFPMSFTRMIIILLLDIVGINFIRYKTTKLYWNLKGIVAGKKSIKNTITMSNWSLIYVIFFACSIVFGFFVELLIYWIIPYVTIYQMFNRVRLFSEHYNFGNDDNKETRTVIPRWFENIFFNSYNLGYHAEHHFFPSVPFYNLPKLHTELKGHPRYVEKVMIDKSYFSVFRKCLKS